MKFSSSSWNCDCNVGGDVCINKMQLLRLTSSQTDHFIGAVELSNGNSIASPVSDHLFQRGLV